MSTIRGFKYYNNLAIYPIDGLTNAKDYGENLEFRYDKVTNTLHKERIFCLDCFDYKTCRGRCWIGCPYRAKALKIIRG